MRLQDVVRHPRRNLEVSVPEAVKIPIALPDCREPFTNRLAGDSCTRGNPRPPSHDVAYVVEEQG